MKQPVTAKVYLRLVFPKRPSCERYSIGLAKRTCRYAFTLLELLVVVAIISILASLLLPALAKARNRAQGIMCLNNTKQLVLAWVVYADDHNGRLPYNLGGDLNNNNKGIAPKTNINWVNNIL